MYIQKNGKVGENFLEQEIFLQVKKLYYGDHLKKPVILLEVLSSNLEKNGMNIVNLIKNQKTFLQIPQASTKIKVGLVGGDFLGSGYVATHLRNYRSYNEARKFVITLGIRNQNEWRKYCRSNQKPDDIPHNAETVYKNKGWKGWGDWFGTGTIAHQDKNFKTFEEARIFAQSLGLENREKWVKYCKGAEKPSDVPVAPSLTYKNKGWKGWGDFLGTGRIASHLKKFRRFEDARAFVQALHLKSSKEWMNFCNSGKKPDDIPATPNETFKNKGWRGWGNFLGTGTISNVDKSKNWLSWKTAKLEYRKIAKENKLKNKTDWDKYVKTHELPTGLSKYPWEIYTKEKIKRRVN